MTESSSCCGCLSLRTGVIIIGWISVISCVHSSHAALKEFRHHGYSKGRAEGFMFIMGYLLQIVAGVLLLLGAWQKRAGYLIPFMILTSVITVALSIFLLVNYCTDYEYKMAIEEHEENHDDFSENDIKDFKKTIRKEMKVQTIAFSITVLINLIFLWVVKSYYHELRKTSTDKSPSLDDVIVGEIPPTSGTAPPPYPVTPVRDPSAPPLYPAVPPPYTADPPPYPGDVKHSIDDDLSIKKTKPEDMA